VPSATAPGLRERNRQALITAIKAAARSQLAARGASELSLRAIARDLEMASSAIYRYFPSRDELLTALIIDAYDALGAAAERADTAPANRSAPIVRWRAVCGAAHSWALDNPHEYALVFGSPIADYHAPVETIEHATRLMIVLSDIMIAATRAGAFDGEPEGRAARSLDVDSLSRFMPEVPLMAALRGLIAWTQLFGMISFELFGHLVGSVSDTARFFDAAVDQMGGFIGLDRA